MAALAADRVVLVVSVPTCNKTYFRITIQAKEIVFGRFPLFFENNVLSLPHKSDMLMDLLHIIAVVVLVGIGVVIYIKKRKSQ